jgi:hypothetical protein
VSVLLVALAWTLAIELPVAWLVRPSRGADGASGWMATCASANVLSHPLACAVLASVGFVVAELGVVALETLAYRHAAGASFRRALVVAVVANAVSASASRF